MTAATKRKPARRQARTVDADHVPKHVALLEEAIVAVENDDVFQNWLRFRSRFHNYSANNMLLISIQCPQASLIAGYKAWANDHNRQVRKGEKGIVILAPMIRRYTAEDPKTGEETKRRRVVGFRDAYVFDVSQTEGDPLPPAPPRATIEGDSHAPYIPKLITIAEDLGYRVIYEDLDDCEGYCDPGRKIIAAGNDAAPNAVVRILVHEIIHALGTSYTRFGRHLAETITDSATFVVCGAIGLDIKTVVAQYVSGWSNAELRQQALTFIDFYACAIERALGLHDRTPTLPPEIDDKNKDTVGS